MFATRKASDSKVPPIKNIALISTRRKGLKKNGIMLIGVTKACATHSMASTDAFRFIVVPQSIP
jgi:hypothetical protein